MESNMQNELLNLIITSYSDEDDMFFSGCLNLIKRYSCLHDLNDKLISQLINMLPKVNNVYNKAALIEILLEIPELEFDNIYKILDEYIVAISQEISNFESAITCLDAFIISGVEKNDLFIKIAEKFNKNEALKILIELGVEWEEAPSTFSELMSEVKISKRIKYRSYIISTFLLIVHPLWKRNYYISFLPTSYPSLITAIVDWGWKTKGSTNYLIERKIISSREGVILEQLGAILSHDFEGNSEEIIKLYDDFFDRRDPLEVIFSLPE